MYAKKAYSGKIDELMSENVTLKMSLGERINLNDKNVSMNGSDDKKGLTLIAEQNHIIQEQQVRIN